MSGLDDSTSQLNATPLIITTGAGGSIGDPSTADASVVVFDRELPLEVRHSDDEDSNLGTLLTIKVKLLVLVRRRRWRDEQEFGSSALQRSRGAAAFAHRMRICACMPLRFLASSMHSTRRTMSPRVCVSSCRAIPIYSFTCITRCKTRVHRRARAHVSMRMALQISSSWTTRCTPHIRG
jgi:hypothetical protein